MTPYEICFSNGTADATDRNGPLLGNGQVEDMHSYLKLQNLQGLHCDQITKTKVFLQYLGLPWWSIGRWKFVLPLPRIRIVRLVTIFKNLSLNLVGALDYQNFPVSLQPAPPGTQVQVYDGTARLSWESTEQPNVFTIPDGTTITGPGGSTDIQVRVTLSYNIIIDPSTGQPIIEHPDTNVLDGIKGELVGVIQDPGLPGASPSVTATFDSVKPIRFGEPTAEFEVNSFILRGNWL